MTSTPEELEAAILALPRDERARLAERIIASLDREEEVEEAWREEVERRLDAYHRDELETVPSDEVLDAARAQCES